MELVCAFTLFTGKMTHWIKCTELGQIIYLFNLSFSFVFCKMGIITSTSQTLYDIMKVI